MWRRTRGSEASLCVGGKSSWFGSHLHSSVDGGKTENSPRPASRPKTSCRAHRSNASGISHREPPMSQESFGSARIGACFCSPDNGENWEIVMGLMHPSVALQNGRKAQEA